jgi:hypothetical protein
VLINIGKCVKRLLETLWSAPKDIGCCLGHAQKVFETSLQHLKGSGDTLGNGQIKIESHGCISQRVSRCFDWLHVKMKILANELPAIRKQFPTVSLHLSGIFSLFLVSTSVLLNIIKI